MDLTRGGALTTHEYARFKTIKTVFQQQQLFDFPSMKVKNRIVSIAKPYVRPIVRGKETKDVEFGMKVHMNQVGGINIIEQVSFDNFNECKLLKYSIVKNKIRFSCTHLAADRIYPTNQNRRYCTQNGITTNFDKKGQRKMIKQPTK